MTIPQAWVDDLGTEDDVLSFLEELDPEWMDHFPSDMPELAIDHYMTYMEPKEWLEVVKRWRQ